MKTTGKTPGKERGTAVVFVVAPVFLAMCATAVAYSGGTGTAADPYQIANAEDWAAFSRRADDWDNCFMLTADIDFANADLIPAGNSTPFCGVLEGKGHTLRNGRVNAPETDNAGLFGVVGADGKIQNLVIEGVSVIGKSSVGGLAGMNRGAITSCRISGAVHGGNFGVNMGGLVGCNEGGVIVSCVATGEVKGGVGSRQIGGLAGYNSGAITSSHAEAKVGGDESSVDVGGLVGCNDGGTISACYAGSVVGGGWCVGGLVGANPLGRVSDCYATGAVEGIFNSVGGLVGFNRDELAACYATGQVTGNKFVGGLTGQSDEGVVTACFWDMESSARKKSAAGRGLLTVQMGQVVHFQNAGWNAHPWVMREGAPPRLAWEGMSWPAIPEAKGPVRADSH